jgi:hypothetical protein
VAGVPAWLRAQVPFVHAGGRLVAVGGDWLQEAPKVKRVARGVARGAGKGGPATCFRLIWRAPI